MFLHDVPWADENFILSAQSGLASCLDDLGRYDEALYARRVAIRGVSHEDTLLSGRDSFIVLALWDEVKHARPATRG